MSLQSWANNGWLRPHQTSARLNERQWTADCRVCTDLGLDLTQAQVLLKERAEFVRVVSAGEALAEIFMHDFAGQRG